MLCGWAPRQSLRVQGCRSQRAFWWLGGGCCAHSADELNLDVAREHDLVRVAQYHVNRHSNRNDLAQAILNEFSSRTAAVTENHRILARLPVSVYWTTNYDRTIEQALELNGKVVDVKHQQDHLVQNRHDRDAIVYKMHGDCQHPSEAILNFTSATT